MRYRPILLAIVVIFSGISAGFLIWKSSTNIPPRPSVDSPIGEQAVVGSSEQSETETPPENIKQESALTASVIQAAPQLKSAFDSCRASADFAVCLDEFFRGGLFDKYSTKTILQHLDRLQKTDQTIRIMCHEIVHAIGRETFSREKTIPQAFAACDQTCHSGCYHGAMERFLRGDQKDVAAEERAHISEKEIASRVAEACPPQGPINLRFQCLHGLGHAVVFYLDYDLRHALSLCDRLGSSWDSASCWGGAFMENVHAQNPSKRFLSPSDYHFPCSVLNEKYKSNCYIMQTTRFAEMGLSRQAIINECANADRYRLECLQSLGRDASNDVRAGNIKDAAALCEGITDDDGQHSCIRGTAYALADNTWDGRYVFPFCRALTSDSDRRFCYELSVNYLKTMLLVSREKLEQNCGSFAISDVLCLEQLKNF